MVGGDDGCGDLGQLGAGVLPTSEFLVTLLNISTAGDVLAVTHLTYWHTVITISARELTSKIIIELTCLVIIVAARRTAGF